MRGDARDMRILAALHERSRVGPVGSTAESLEEVVGQSRGAILARLRSMRTRGWVTRGKRRPREPFHWHFLRYP